MVSKLPQLQDTRTGPMRLRSDSGQVNPSNTSDGQPSENEKDLITYSAL